MHVLRNSALVFGFAGLFASMTARADDPVVIVAPEDGAVVPAEFTVKISYGDIEYCDTDGCVYIPAEMVTLNADSSSVEQCLSCPVGEVEFDIMLGPGEHTLDASAAVGTEIVYSEPVKISVEEAPTTGASDGTGSGTNGSSGDDTSSTGKSGDDDGCACGMADGPATGLAWLGILPVLASRRRPVNGRPHPPGR